MDDSTAMNTGPESVQSVHFFSGKRSPQRASAHRNRRRPSGGSTARRTAGVPGSGPAGHYFPKLRRQQNHSADGRRMHVSVQASSRNLSAASQSARADRTSARFETSGTATSHQCPPASEDGYGSLRITITWVSTASRARPRASSSSATESAFSACAPNDRGCATKSTLSGVTCRV